MTGKTIMREERGDMIRRRCRRKIILVTTVTIRGGPFELTVRMT